MGYALLLGMENRANQEKGEEYHSSFRAYIKDGSDRIVSPIHDIPLKQELANDGSSYEVPNKLRTELKTVSTYVFPCC